MRDKRYKAAHRGGPLSAEQHQLLAEWAAGCAEHVAYLFIEQQPEDDRPLKAVETAKAWCRGEVTVGEARAAALKAHAAARETGQAAAQYAARAAGHAVATAHMADHALEAATYAVKAVGAATDEQTESAAIGQERAWQKEYLPEKIRELVISTFEESTFA